MKGRAEGVSDGKNVVKQLHVLSLSLVGSRVSEREMEREWGVIGRSESGEKE